MAAAFADGEPKTMDGNAIMASLTEQPIFYSLCIVIRVLAIVSFDLGNLFFKQHKTTLANLLKESQKPWIASLTEQPSPSFTHCIAADF